MKAIFLILLSIFQLQYSWCSVVLIDKGFEFIEFNEQYNIFIDSNNIWKEKGIENIKHEEAFYVYNKQYLKLRSNYPVFLKFDIKTSNIVEENFILDFQHADIDKLQLYVVDNEGNFFISNILGDKQPFYNRYKQYRFFAIPVKLAPNKEYKIFLCVRKT